MNKIDTSQFNDAIAARTSWKPSTIAVSSFKTRKLALVKNNQLSFEPTLSMKLFGAFFILVGFYLLAFLGSKMPAHSWWVPTSLLHSVVIPLISLYFVLFGLGMLYLESSPIIFDGNKSTFSQGRGNQINTINFSDIHALQLIPQSVSTSNALDDLYQLNIVLSNAERVNVTRYRDASVARQESKTVSEFVDITLWDATTIVRK
ncbi:MAG: hypothetical protein V3U65_16015 [Granulosicoccaceae bacterium]